jgi:general secretion pathway protein D
VEKNKQHAWPAALPRAIAVCALLLGLACGAVAQERVTLKFVNAEIDAVVRAIGSYTGRTFVTDPRVKGTLNLISDKPLSRDQALAALTSALRLQGFAIVDVGNVSRVVLEADAKFQGGRVQSGEGASVIRGEGVQTHVFRLQYEPVANVLAAVRPLVPPNNPVTAYPSSNSLIVTDYAENLRRIEKVIAALDRPPVSDTEVITLQHAIASDLALIIMRVTDQAGAPPDPLQKVTAMADPVTNSIIVRTASATAMRNVRRLVERLDQPAPPGQGVYVVPLKNMEAVELAKTLSSIKLSDPIGAQRVSGAAGTPGQPVSTAPASSPTIVADAATNSLIITASDSAYRQLRGVLDRLDVRRAQVFIEALLVEVSGDQSAEFGIQWQTGLDSFSGDSTSIGGGTNFGDSTQNIISGAQNPANLGRGLNIGVIQGQVTIPGLGTITNLSVLARALETKSNSNILATPNIFTLDNEEAKLVVGQNVPFITGQFVSQAGGATVTPFQTIERRDVGLTIRVKPQISEGGTVRMNVYQEVSSVVDQRNPAGVITNKRSLETNVLVDDGGIVVLGGLIQDQLDNGSEKVPLLGDIPGLGYLFRYDTRRRQKTNLMLFLRPVVVRDEDAARVLTTDRYDYMRKLQQNTQPPPHFALPQLEAPVMPGLPEWPPANGGGTPAPAAVPQPPAAPDPRR